MTISKALEAVAARYVPGVVAYYGKQSPDPWQTAHDELERIAGIMDEAMVTPVLERFVERCTEMIERYLANQLPPTSPSPADHFASNDDIRIQAHISRRRKQCIHCDGKEGLKIVALEPGSIEVMLVCRACLARKSA